MRNAIDLLQKGTVIPATPLALDENRVFDEAAQRRLIRYYLKAGAGGIATAVHTTQFEIRMPEHDLYKTILEVVADEINRYEQIHKTVIIKVAGVCGPLVQAIQEAQLAKSLGYDTVLLSPGGLDDHTEEALLKRTEEVARILPVIGFYLQEAVGGRVFRYNYWESLCEINGVAAIKLAPFNRYQTLEAVRAAAFATRNVALYTGNDDHIVLDLISTYRFQKNGKVYEKKFVGGLLGHWSVWTHSAVQIFNRIKKEGPTADLFTLAHQITDCNAAFFDTANEFKGCIAGLHEVLRRQGLLKGIWCLNTDETLSNGQADEIERVYTMYPHLNDDAFVTKFLRQEEC